MTRRPQPLPFAVLPALAGLTALCLSGAARAQDAGWSSFVSVSPLFEDAGLDGGGEARVGGAILRAGSSTAFGGMNRVGITVNYDYLDYSFDDPKAFGGVAPWGVLQRYGFAVPLSFVLDQGWIVGVTPSLDWFRESGASNGDARVWGAALSAVKRFADGNMIGLGVGAFSGIDKNTVFPFPVVDWRFDAHWRLINPLAAGPTGPAGLELDYQFDNGWTLGGGVAWRSARYRLSRNGPTPDGVGEISGAPVYLRAAREFAGGLTLNLYAGVVAGGELRVEDSTGRLLHKDDLELSPIVGANLSLRF